MTAQSERLKKANEAKTAEMKIRVEEVRLCLMAYPGIANKELAVKLSLSLPTITKYVRMIRGEWKRSFMK